MKKLLLLSAIACTPIVEPAEGLRPHDADFYLYWSNVEECSGLVGNPDAVRVYVLAGSTVTTNGREVSAYYSPSGYFIVFAGDWIDQPNLWRHEILHALLRRGGHPAEYFAGPCQPIVTYGSAIVD